MGTKPTRKPIARNRKAPPAERPVQAEPDSWPVPFIVGIGASAGGLEALERVFEHLPPGETGLAFVVVQHLSPDHKSLMVDLLSKRTSLPVTQVEDGVTVAADTVYVLPPGKTVIIREGVLRLAAKDLRHGIVLPIDIFLNSLAIDRGVMAAGVILSGTGSDGTRGVRALHEQGGLVIAQTPETARFDGMPRSAIETGIVDEIMTPEDVGARLVSFAAQTMPIRSRSGDAPLQVGVDSDEINRIIRVLQSQTGTDFAHYRRGTLIRRIERRMHLNQVDNFSDYAVLVAASPQEAANLRKELLISVTAFFRDGQPFDDVRKMAVAPILSQTEEGGAIRAWVCGCATGEEAYSLAILFAEAAAIAGRTADIKVFATDIDRHALDFASNGIYPESTVADIDPVLLDRYFTRSGDSYKVSAALRRMVLFASHNVIKDPPFTKLDLVSCRNLLIYFEPELQQSVLCRLQFALKLGGWLFLGSSETLGPVAPSFSAISAKSRIFRLTAPAVLPLSGLSDSSNSDGPAGRRVHHMATNPSRKSAALAVEEAARCLIRQTCPPSLLVSEGLELVHNFGGVERFLRLPIGEASLDLLKHLPAGLSTLVSATLHRVFREWREVQLQNLAIETGGTVEVVNLIVRPVTALTGSPRHVLMLFSPITQPLTISPDAMSMNVDQAASERIAVLEGELQTSRENQQTVIEELETTNEELQATNEELLASNEELQSANEELQSVNEELYTVNSELKEKVDELTRLTADLDNLMEATGIGIIFLDAFGTVRRFTPSAVGLVNLMERDIGRAIFDLSNTLDYPEFFDDIRKVLRAGERIERECECADGRTLLVRTSPYRSDQGQTEGAILTFVDVTPIKGAQRQLQIYLDSLPYEVSVIDRDGEILLVNSAWTRFAVANGGHPDRVGTGTNYFDACRISADANDPISQQVLAGLRQVLDGSRQHFTIEYPCNSPSAARWFMMNVGPTEGGGAVISHIDITERKRSEENLRMASKVFECSGEAILITDHAERIISANPAFHQVTGWGPDEIVGKTPRLLQSGRHSQQFYRQMWEELQHSGIWRGEVWNRRRNGQVFPEWLVISAVRDSTGRVTNYVAVFSDISERKAAEQRLMDINAELEQFAYVASHDLREPLRMINSYLSLVERRVGGNLDSDIREFIQFATDGAKRMDQLILHLLEYSRIGRVTDDRGPIALADLIKEALSFMEPARIDAQAEVTTMVQDLKVCVIKNECVRLFQNIIANALKYRSPDRNPSISISAVASGETVMVAIADNGIGIETEQHDRIFRMFQRLHGRDEFGGGTGIGLAVCKKIVEHHGGRIWVESLPGEGATFFFTLPASAAAFQPPGQ